MSRRNATSSSMSASMTFSPTFPPSLECFRPRLTDGGGVAILASAATGQFPVFYVYSERLWAAETMKTTQLRTRVPVAEPVPLMAAAEALCLSQPAVTKSIKELEARLGV